MEFPLDQGKAILSAKISISSARADFLATSCEVGPTPLEVRALIDTGASISIVDEEYLGALRIYPRGFCDVLSFHNEESTPRKFQNYDIDLEILGRQFKNLQVVGARLMSTHFQMLLGRDILVNFDYSFLNSKDTFQID